LYPLAEIIGVNPLYRYKLTDDFLLKKTSHAMLSFN